MTTIYTASPALDRVLRAVAGGAGTSAALRENLGVSRYAVNRAVCRLVERGLVVRPRRGHFELSAAGAQLLASGAAVRGKAGRRPGTQHPVMTVMRAGVSSHQAIAEAVGLPASQVVASIKRLRATGRAEQTALGASRLTAEGCRVLAAYDALFGTHVLPAPPVQAETPAETPRLTRARRVEPRPRPRPRKAAPRPRKAAPDAPARPTARLGRVVRSRQLAHEGWI